MAPGKLREPRVVDLREGHGAEAALVELVQRHDLHRAGDDLAVEALVDSLARELVRDDEDLDSAFVDGTPDLRQGAEVRAREGLRIELPVIGRDRRGHLEVTAVGMLELVAQPGRLGGRADNANADSRMGIDDAAAEPDDDQRFDRGQHEGARVDAPRRRPSGGPGRGRSR